VTDQTPTADVLYQEAHDAMGRRDARAAIDLLELMLQQENENAHAWRLYGFALREEQRMGDALAAFRRAEMLAPEDALTATAIAQTEVQCGLPALKSARRAVALTPSSPSLILTLASALSAEGRKDDAIDALTGELARNPSWLEGQYRLAEMRWTDGDQLNYARGYEAAALREPQNLRLRLAWFRFVAQARDWPAARRILVDAEQTFGAQTVFLVARAYLAAESGEHAQAETLFRQTEGLNDEVRDLAWIRYCLRTQRAAAAEPAALRLLSTPSANLAWPYLSLIWRIAGDPRAEWLDGAPPFVRAMEVGLSAADLEELAELLRGLHTAKSPYIEQSVRGGTQTERPLFFRTDPIIERTKAKISEAVREYIDLLPPRVAGHPLLGPPRHQVLYAGSWSVRLLQQGYNVAHTHPLGWLSSAFYVALPAKDDMGKPPAGWIRFGAPPTDLGLGLAPYAQVQPRVGRLVLFPSTMWHDTVPFAAGERLVLAFDVRTPTR
jgi:tetratricopeptide (TPR) repeat protein